MIYTVTFNPSLDYVIHVKNCKAGKVNRSCSEKIMCGGKGINVSIVLKNLGIDSVALGFIAGFTGTEILRDLHDKNCFEDFITLKNGYSRINVKLKSGVETDINGQGPDLTKEDFSNLLEKLDVLKTGDILVLAGSIPSTMPQDTYEKILDRLKTKQIKVVVDATKDLLLRILKYHPFLIKPNHFELGEMFDIELSTKEEIIFYAKKLKEMGACNVLISMAGNGAILVSEEGNIYESQAPAGTVINSVGAGDSMVAGFVAGYLNKTDYKKAFLMGVAAGSASAFSVELATKQEVDALLKTLE